MHDTSNAELYACEVKLSLVQHCRKDVLDTKSRITECLTETGRVRQSAVIHCQIRLVYSKLGVIASVRFTRATN